MGSKVSLEIKGEAWMVGIDKTLWIKRDAVLLKADRSMATGNVSPNVVIGEDAAEVEKYMEVRTCLSEGTKKVC